MSEPIKPALTPEEWPSLAKKFYRREVDCRSITIARPDWGVFMLQERPKPLGEPGYDYYRIAAVSPEECHALAALALYGQPFGFTREDVVLVRVVAEEWSGDMSISGYTARLNSIAKRIEALLPPEK